LKGGYRKQFGKVRALTQRRRRNEEREEYQQNGDGMDR
jgi:hypothetical protein